MSEPAETRPLRLLMAVTYYRPHVSGLTVYVQRLAEALVLRGHRVTVLTSHFRDDLPHVETVRGVRIVRVPVLARISKGVVLPTFLPRALRLLRESDLAVINLPASPSEAVLLPLAARIAVRRPTVAIYHCDVRLPGGIHTRLLDRAVFLCNLTAASLVRRIVAYTEDYARHSELLRRFPDKIEVIAPPVVMPEPDPSAVEAFRRRFAPCGERLLCVASRLAAEKGIEDILRALPIVRRHVGPVRVLFAGDDRHTIGEEANRRKLQPLVAAQGDAWVPLGILDTAELAVVFAASSVTLLPSVNSTESFGLVQVESMLCGTPVVASDLPGVRVPILTTGMGRITPARDHVALAAAVVELITNRSRYLKPRPEIERLFSFPETVARWEQLATELVARAPRLHH